MKARWAKTRLLGSWVAAALATFALLIAPAGALAQWNPGGGGGSGGGGGGTPGGSSGQTQYNNAGAFGGFTMVGDCTLAQPTITCAGLAPKASPTFTGTPVAPTPPTGDNSTAIATTAFVKAQAYGVGSVTSVTPGPGLSSAAGTCAGSAITTTGTLSACNGVNTQTGTTYTVVAADAGKTINWNNSAGGTITLPQAGTTGFENGRTFCFTSQLGSVTVNPVTSTAYGASPSFIAGQTICAQSDGTNYLITGNNGPDTHATTVTLLAGLNETIRLISAAGAVTVTTSDTHVCIKKATPATTTVNLPVSPVAGQRITVDDCGGNGASFNYTITPNSGLISGAATFVINTAYGSWTGYFDGTNYATTASR